MVSFVLFNPHGGHSRVSGDDGIGTIRSRVKRAHQLGIVTAVTPHNSTGSWDEYLEAMAEVGWGHMAILGVEFKYYTSVEGKMYKGEMILLLPPDLVLMRQVRKLVKGWNDIVALRNEERGLRRLLTKARENISPDLYSRIVWYWPHPYSVDSESIVGRLMVQTLIGKVKLSSPEMRNTEVFSQIHAIEVLNAAHPGRVNRKAVVLSDKPDFAHMAKMAGADDHHDAWVGTAYTMIGVEEETSQGILDAIRKKRTTPMSGLDKWSEGSLPFVLWSMLVPVKGMNIGGGLIGKWVRKQVECNLERFRLRGEVGWGELRDSRWR